MVVMKLGGPANELTSRPKPTSIDEVRAELTSGIAHSSRWDGPGRTARLQTIFQVVQSAGMRALQPALVFVLLALTGCAQAYAPAASPRVTFTTDGVYKNGTKVGSLSYGTPDAVRGSARAESEAELGRSMNIAGWVFQIGGLGTIGAGAAIASGDKDDSKQGLAIGLLVGGLAASLIGDGLWISGNTHSVNAINIYNDELKPTP
jgi:hypothetical protein